MVKNLFSFLVAFMLITFTINVNGQSISVGANFGWANPGGSGVTEAAGDLNLDGGLVYSVDILYKIKPNIGVGIGLTSAILAGAGSGDVDLFGMRVIGAKIHYALKESGFSPYANLTLGVAQLNTPEYTITTGTSTTTVKENSGSAFGIMPELGLSFGKFYLGVQYLVPASYTIKEALITDKSVGTLNYVIGYRYNFSF